MGQSAASGAGFAGEFGADLIGLWPVRPLAPSLPETIDGVAAPRDL